VGAQLALETEKHRLLTALHVLGVNSNVKAGGLMGAIENEILTVQGMLPYLSELSKSEDIHIYDSLESTNTTAKEMALSGAGHGTVIIAESQTAGKGRYGRSFFSPPGHGIYVSFLLRQVPQQLCDVPTRVTAFAAVSVCEAIEAVTGLAPQIKWVNDVLLNGKKICGILTELVASTEAVNIDAILSDSEESSEVSSALQQPVIVGIGVNFSTPQTEFPESIRDSAGSLFMGGKPTITRNRLVAEIINRMLAIKEQFDISVTFNEYKKRLMVLDKKIVVTGFDESYEAIAIDIDDTGRLIVKKESGEVLALFSGEISIGEVE